MLVLGPGTTCSFSRRSLRCLLLGRRYEVVITPFATRLASGLATPLLIKLPFPKGGLNYGIP